MIHYFANNSEKIIPTIMIVCSAISFFVYMYKGMIGQSVYWGSASLLTYSVTYLMNS